jgi:hypothetical protein
VSLGGTNPHASGIDGAASDFRGFDTSAHAIPCFEHHDLLALPHQRSGRAESGETCSDDQDIRVFVSIRVRNFRSVQPLSRDQGSGTRP